MALLAVYDGVGERIQKKGSRESRRIGEEKCKKKKI